MREATRNFWIGLTAIAAALGLATMLFLFGELESFFNDSWSVQLDVPDANGIRKGSVISMFGVPIGRIADVQISRDAAYPVRLIADIDPDVDIPNNVTLYGTSALVGTRTSLEFVVQTPSGPVLPKDGSARIAGTIGSQVLEEIASQLDERMAPVMSALGRFNDVADAIVSVADDVSDMVRPQTESELAEGAPANLRTTTDRIATAVASIDEAAAAANEAFRLSQAWLGDEQLRLNVNDAVVKATTLIEEATVTVSTYTQLANSIEGDADALVRALVPVADDAGLTLDEIRRVMALASEGDGSVGKLLREPDLHNALEDSAVRLERMLVEVQLLVEKIKAEGVKIGL